MKGFLGTGAPFGADLNLVAQLIMGSALIAGVLLARLTLNQPGKLKLDNVNGFFFQNSRPSSSRPGPRHPTAAVNRSKTFRQTQARAANRLEL